MNADPFYRPEPPSGPHVVIVGGGYSGAAVALHLALKAGPPLRITVVESRNRLGAGVAYSTSDPSHRINVPASRMSVFPEDEGHFDHWVRENGAVAADPDATLPDGRIFPRRQVFGNYVQSELWRAVDKSGVDLVHVQDRAVEISRRDAGWSVLTARGETLTADVLVLATSHPLPAAPEVFRDVADDPRLIVNPWHLGAISTVDPDDEVLIVGTGLTMADIVASLERRGHRGRITAISRRGLTSRGHGPADQPPRGDFANPPAIRVSDLVRRIRTEIAAAREDGHGWQSVLDAVRRDAGSIWAALDDTERCRLLRHLRSFWDVHRYRVSPQVEAVTRRRLATRRLEVLAASIRGVRSVGAGIETELYLRGRGQGRGRTITSQAVILATGPAHHEIIGTNEALAGLFHAGHLRGDALGLGVDVDDQSRVIAHDGRPHDNLFVAGPLARARFGELMGLPQVTRHAEAVAARVSEVLLSNCATA